MAKLKGLPPAIHRLQALSVAWTIFNPKYCLTFGGQFKIDYTGGFAMEKRKYTKVEAFEAEMIAMREAGKTKQEIADYLGLEKAQIKNWINRYNRKQINL